MRSFIICAVAAALPLDAPAQGLVTGSAPLPTSPKAAGDVDGDGVGDFAGLTGGNRIVVSGATGLAISYLTQPTPLGNQGYFGVGDTNADGHDDLVFFLSASTAFLLSGADGTTLHSWTTPPPPVHLYTGCVGGADFDGDGFGDVVLIAGGYRCLIHSGRTGAILFDQVFGSADDKPVVSIGDTDGDGFDDVSLTQYWGMMHVARGPGLTPIAISTGQPRPVGDVNGNGANDLAIRTSAGTRAVVDGATGAVLGTLPWVMADPAIVGELLVLLDVGDIDGDGGDDLRAWTPAFSFPPPGFPGFDCIVSSATLLPVPGSAGIRGSLGDVDGDGRDEMWGSLGTEVEWLDPAVPIASTLTRRGASGTTSLGTKPRITTRGSCASGRQAFFDVRGTLPNSLSLFVIGSQVDVDLAPLGAPANRLYTTLDGMLLLVSDGFGLAVQSFTMPTSPSLLGSTVSVQAANFDPAANPLGFVTSNAIDVATNN